jgi:hypothetical protein
VHSAGQRVHRCHGLAGLRVPDLDGDAPSCVSVQMSVDASMQMEKGMVRISSHTLRCSSGPSSSADEVVALGTAQRPVASCCAVSKGSAVDWLEVVEHQDGQVALGQEHRHQQLRTGPAAAMSGGLSM